MSTPHQRAPRPARAARPRSSEPRATRRAPAVVARTTTDAVRQFADSIGERVEEIRQLDPTWVSMLRNGCIVEVHAGRWRASTGLTLADIGIDEATLTAEQRHAYEKTLVLGDVLLLPKDEKAVLDKIDGRARTRTRQLSLRTRLGPFVEARNYTGWKADMIQLRAEYLAAAASQFERWTEITGQGLRDYAIIALQNYGRLRHSWQGTDGEFRRRFGDEQTFIEASVARIAQQIPPRAYAEKLVRFEWEVGYVPTLSMVAEDEAEAVRIRAASNLALVESNAIAERTRARNAALLEMERDIAAEAAKAKTKTLDVIQDLQSTLHTEVYTTIVEAMEVLREGKPLQDGTPRVPVGRLRSLIEYVERLKFWDDPLLESNMAEIEALINVERGSRRNSDDVANKLRDAAAASKLVLLNFDEYVELRSSRTFGVPDDLAGVEAMVRTGGRSLSAVDETPTPTARRSRRALAEL